MKDETEINDAEQADTGAGDDQQTETTPEPAPEPRPSRPKKRGSLMFSTEPGQQPHEVNCVKSKRVAKGAPAVGLLVNQDKVLSRSQLLMALTQLHRHIADNDYPR